MCESKRAETGSDLFTTIRWVDGLVQKDITPGGGFDCWAKIGGQIYFYPEKGGGGGGGKGEKFYIFQGGGGGGGGRI